MRLLNISVMLLILGACAPVLTDGYDTRGGDIPLAIYQQPLCVAVCNNGLQTTGSTSRTTGDNATGGSTTQSPSTTTTGGGVSGG